MGGPLVVAVVGATATGKTDLGEALAAATDGEVVCADSRQVFRELEIGTGKPSPAERGERPHHLFDALGLGERPSAGWYASAAGAVCAAIHSRGRTPVLVGGSGLWLRAAQHGLSGEPPHEPAVRERLRRECDRLGVEALHARLALLDPPTAARLSPRDRQRITRALEVCEASGRPLSWWHGRRGRPALVGEWHVIELTAAAGVLGSRIERRTAWMLESGLLDEARALAAAGHEPALRRLRAVGYDEALDVIAGLLDPAEAAARITLRTRQLAKRQRTWFRHQVEAIRLDAGEHGTAGLLAAALRSLGRAAARRSDGRG